MEVPPAVSHDELELIFLVGSDLVLRVERDVQFVHDAVGCLGDNLVSISQQEEPIDSVFGVLNIAWVLIKVEESWKQGGRPVRGELRNSGTSQIPERGAGERQVAPETDLLRHLLDLLGARLEQQAQCAVA